MAKIKNPMTVVSAGGGSVIVSKSITQNGTYNASSDSADGYNPVTVNVPPTLFRELVDGSSFSVTAADVSGITSIRQYAFAYSGIASVELPSTITSIGQFAFEYCDNLTSAIFPAGATMGNSVFEYTRNITNAVVPDVPQRTFYQGNFLVNVTVLEGATQVGQRGFYTCNRLTKLVLPSTIASIASQAFQNASSLIKLVLLPTSAPSLASTDAFSGVNANYVVYVPTPDVYKAATNWVSIASHIFPLVATVADLSNIDTTTYTKACVTGTGDYKEYTYDGSQWNEVV